jgi:hypothetical protein
VAETVECSVCGRTIPYERSRLWWAKGDDGKFGTFRTCVNEGVCRKRAQVQRDAERV